MFAWRRSHSRRSLGLGLGLGDPVALRFRMLGPAFARSKRPSASRSHRSSRVRIEPFPGLFSLAIAIASAWPRSRIRTPGQNHLLKMGLGLFWLIFFHCWANLGALREGISPSALR